MLYSYISNKSLATITGRINRIMALLPIALGCVLCAAAADKYQVIKISTPRIVIGGKTLKVGDTFNEQAVINWSADPQTLEAKNLSNGRIRKYSRKQFEAGTKVTSLKDFYLRSTKASTRGINNGDYSFITSNNSAKYPERRIALIIGNSAYTTLTTLKNPINDASDLTDQFIDLGFDVFLLYDGSYQAMRNALIEFGDKAAGYNAAVVYYSGHGVQNDKHSYLIPIEATLEFRSELEKCIDCNDVLDMLDATRCDTRIAFFDACRDVKTNWTRSVSQEVSAIEGSPGTVIFFSTRSGRVAQDGDGLNSPFAKSLITNIKEPIEFSELSTRLVKNTYIATNKMQYPIMSGTLLSDFKFNPLASQSSAKRTQATPMQQPRQSQSQTQANTSTATSTTTPKPTISISCSDVDIKINAFHRSGTTVSFNLFITNLTESTFKGQLQEIEPCNGYLTQVYDDKGGTYEKRKISACYGENNAMNQPQAFPPNVPIKMTIRIFDVPQSVSYFPLINLQFRGFPSGKSYGITQLQIKNLPEDVNVPSSGTSSQTKQSTPAATPTIDTCEGIKVSATYLKRSGDTVIFNLWLTNITESTFKGQLQDIEPCNGYLTQAYDDKGGTYEKGKISARYGENNAMHQPQAFPPNVPVKMTIRIYDVPQSVSYFPLINLQFRGFPSGKSYGIANIKLHNMPFDTK